MMNWANEKRWYPHTFCLIPTSSLGGYKVKTPTHYTWWEEKFLLFPSLNKSSWSNLLPFCFIPGAPPPPHQRLPKADKFPIHIALHLAIFTDSLLAVSALSQDSLSPVFSTCSNPALLKNLWVSWSKHLHYLLPSLIWLATHRNAGN